MGSLNAYIVIYQHQVHGQYESTRIPVPFSLYLTFYNLFSWSLSNLCPLTNILRVSPPSPNTSTLPCPIHPLFLPCPTHRDKDEEWRHELPADPPVDHGAKTEHVLDVCAKPSQSWGKGELDEELVGQIV